MSVSPRSVYARLRGGLDAVLEKVFPDHWSFLLGEIALFCFVVLLVTGIPLAFLYEAGSDEVIYHGAYAALDGTEMSRSFASTLRLSFDRSGGIILRQAHHWAALVFVAAITVHASRVFLTGAFRHPRRRNWLVGLTLLVLALATGQFGMALPDDLQSGASLRITHATVLSLPVIGAPLALMLFGGEFPASGMLVRLYWMHVLVVPVVMVGLVGLHLRYVFRHTHTQFADAAPRPDRVSGVRFWPHHAIRAGSLFAFTAAVLAGLGAAVQINPIWLYGPFNPAAVSAPSQPDWYLGWVEGALRIVPAVDFVVLGYEVPSPFFAGVLIPVVVLGTLYVWPFAEARLTSDPGPHHVAEGPTDRPVRTGFFAAGLVFLAVLLAAASHDVQARLTGVPLEALTWAYRIAAVALPVASGLGAWRLCHEVQRTGRSHPKPVEPKP